MRSYGQFCGLARALDVVGDRWSMLIVRELLLQGPARYTDLKNGLPGIATNLLVDRLRELEEAGVVTHQDAKPPVATALFKLTPWGEQLRPIVLALGRWARPLMGKQARADHVRAHWLALPLESMLVDRSPKQRPIRIELRPMRAGKPMLLETHEGRVRVRTSDGEPADAVLSGPADVIIALLAGRIGLATARARRVRVRGHARVLRRIGPAPERLLSA